LKNLKARRKSVVDKMSAEKTTPHVEQKVSEYFRTLSIDYYQFWIEPEVTKLLFFTDHYFTREKSPFKETINKDDILRELQTEIRVPTSLAIRLTFALLKRLNTRAECPVCKSIEQDLLVHMEKNHPMGAPKIEPDTVQKVQ
jgi:hypothetical protein